MKACTQCKARFTGNPQRCPLDGAALVDLPDPLIGKVIGGRYRIESKLGAGGMATVYRGVHDSLGRKVAIKFLSRELAVDEVQRQRFLREGQATNRLKHENIVDISDFGEDKAERLVYLVMELLEGQPLSGLIAAAPVAPRDAIDYVTQTARALARAHELEVIHRDLKPDNIFMVTREGRAHVKLLDFGLAHVPTEDVQLTRRGSIFGTPEYMSPEQARGAEVGTASDLYSLGVVFFELLARRIPFEGSTAKVLFDHINTAPPTVSSFNPSLPAEVDAVVSKLLSKNPAHRHRDAHHLIDDLASLLTLLPEDAPRRTNLEKATAPAIDIESFRSLMRASSEDAAPGSLAPRADADPTHASVRSWIERRALYRRALELTRDGAGHPAHIVRSAEKLDELVDRAVRLDTEMQTLTRNLAERETAVSDKRRRIGRALDVLTRDEHSTLGQCEDIERRIKAAQSRMALASTDFTRAWTEATSLIVDGTLSSVQAARAVESAAHRATVWRQNAQEAAEEMATLETRRPIRDDLRFQITQLKGREAALNAEADHELAPLRQRAAELGGDMATLEEQVTDAASALASYLLEFPAVRPMLTSQPGTRLDPVG